MNPFYEAFIASLKGQPTSSGAKAMAQLTGDWFYKYGQQQKDDRESAAKAIADLRQEVKELRDKLFKLENSGTHA